MDIVTGHFTGNNFDLMLQRNLSQQVPCTEGCVRLAPIKAWYSLPVSSLKLLESSCNV